MHAAAAGQRAAGPTPNALGGDVSHPKVKRDGPDAIHASLLAKALASKRQFQMAQAQLERARRSRSGTTEVHHVQQGLQPTQRPQPLTRLSLSIPRPLPELPPSPKRDVARRSPLRASCVGEALCSEYASTPNIDFRDDGDPVFVQPCALCQARVSLSRMADHVASCDTPEGSATTLVRCVFCFRTFTSQALKVHIGCCKFKRA